MDRRYVLVYRTADSRVHHQLLDADTIAEGFMEAVEAVKPAEELYPDLPLEILGVVDLDLIPAGVDVIDPHVRLV